MLSTDEALLDNPVYAALSGPQASFAEVRGRVRRFQADVAPFLAMPPDATAEDWRDAAELISPSSYAATLSRGEVPEGWELVRAFDVTQMVEERLSGADYPEAVTLGLADAQEMLELVAETEPGPFMPRTVELGRYLGVRRDGMLVAMAGERFRLDGWTEISAVCTKPAYRGQGVATRLMAALIAGIHGRSERAFLHVLTTNTGAIRLYEQLGFRIRRIATITVMVPVG